MGKWMKLGRVVAPWAATGASIAGMVYYVLQTLHTLGKI